MPVPTDEHIVRVALRCGRRLCRDALAFRIANEPGFAVVGHAGGDTDLLLLCQLRNPDVVLFDVAGEDLAPALETLGELHIRFPRTRVIVIHERLAPAELDAVHGLGVDALVPCSRGLDAVLVVLRRHIRDRGGATSAGNLTEQERWILTLIAAGHPASSVAEILRVGERTVDNCKSRAYRKLAVANQAQAIARAAELGLLDATGPARLPETRPGRPLVVVRGRNSRVRGQAITALLAAEVPFVVEATGLPAAFGPVLAVLVEPALGGRDPLPCDDGIATLLIPGAPLRRPDTMSLLRRGVLGIIAPHNVDRVLVPAIALLACGHLIVDPAVATELISAGPDRPATGLPEITAREEDILRSISAGHTVRQTARTLGIAPKTVENIQARLFRKLGVHNRAGAAALTQTLGLLETTHPTP